ncbi:MAG: T9SS type A sorting domain-containing protein [Prolixibacteraceae bacterium]|jgi:hypothetical protein|nr:T9SS type A sorting domain-containing protein [Prolixibacteraceae bacterium]
MIQYLKTVFLFSISIFFSVLISAQTQQDTLYAYLAKTPVVVDGNDNDEAWSNAEWHDINQVWIPYNANMEEGDFAGRFKLAWDSLYLYLLTEIIDDSLSDDHSDPLQNYWDDDCVEIFIDEDRSKGNHLTNNNAFAYHVSTMYDVIDGGTGTTVNLKDNLSVVMDTIGENTYLWEFAIKIYDSSFKPNNTEASRVYLNHKKLMGFSLAYCDNDETNSRENFIGSMYMTSAHANDNYITADYFGSLLLVDPEYVETVSVNHLNKTNEIKIFPNPAKDYLIVETQIENELNKHVEIRDISGRLVIEWDNLENNQRLNIESLKTGVYFLRFSSSSFDKTRLFRKQ